MKIDNIDYVSAETVSRTVEGAFVVKVVKRETVVYLNHTASFVWSFLQKHEALPNIQTAAIAKELLLIYEIGNAEEKSVRHDVQNVISSFVENGLLSLVN